MSIIKQLKNEKETLITQQLFKIDSIVDDFLLKFINFFSTQSICKKFTFPNQMFIDIGNLIEIEPGHIKKLLKTAPEINASWKIVNDENYIIILILLIYSYENKDEKRYKKFLYLLTFKIYTTMQEKYFKFGCNENVMKYTISSLSKYFLLSQFEGDLIKTLITLTNSSNQTYEKNFNSDDDKIILEYLINLRTRMNQNIQNLATKYYEDYKEKRFLNSHQDIYDEDGIIISNFNNNSQNILTIKNKLTNYVINEIIDENLFKEIAKKFELSFENLKLAYIRIIKDSKNSNILIEKIFNSNQLIFNKICSKSLLSELMKFLLSKYDDNLFKPALEIMMINELEFYRKSNITVTKAKYRKAITIIFVYFLQKSNCTSN